MKHSSWSDWQTFLGFCAVCVVVTAFIGWQITSAQTRPSEPRAVLSADDRGVEFKQAAAPSERTAPAAKTKSKSTASNSKSSGKVANEVSPEAKSEASVGGTATASAPSTTVRCKASRSSTKCRDAAASIPGTGDLTASDNSLTVLVTGARGGTGATSRHRIFASAGEKR